MSERERVFDERLKILGMQAQQARLKKVVCFDLDGTLAKSKATIDSEMSSLLGSLLERKMVAVIGGGSYTQFENQFLSGLELKASLLKNLFLFPTSGASFYRLQNGTWIQIYEYKLTSQEREKIMTAFEEAFKKINYKHPAITYGEIIENRGTQITFSALGQKAPLEAKKEWGETKDRRKELTELLKQSLPEFEVRLGGLTSIDVTKKGIDKAFGIQQIINTLKSTKNDMIFIGDSLYEGGNDYPVKSTGVETVQVTDPEDTKFFIRKLLAT